MPDSPAPPNTNKKYRRYYTYIEPVITDPIIKGYFTLVSSMLLCAFFILFALSPTFSTIVGLVRKINDQKKLIAQMDSKISNLIVAQENYTQIEPLLPLLNTAFPTKPAPETVILGTLQVASRSAVTLSTFQISQAYLSGEKPLKSNLESVGDLDVTKSSRSSLISALGIPILEFTVGVRGSESYIRQFMGKMENLPRVTSLAIVTIGIDDQQEIPDPSRLVGNIVAAAYYLPRGKAPVEINP